MDEGCITVIKARKGLFRFFKAKALKSVNSKAIKKFVRYDIIIYFGLFIIIKVNNGSENKGLVIDLINDFLIRLRIGSVYHAPNQRLVKMGY